MVDSIMQFIKAIGNELKKRSELLKRLSLYSILGLLQIASLTTTIEGAKILLSSLKPYTFFGIPIEAYVILGCGVQLFLLWLFTIGKHTIKSPFRKWTLILVYTFASIYTSFFAFYQGLTGIDLTQNNNTIAINRHNELKKFLYVTQAEKLEEIDKRIKTVEQNSATYFDIGNGEKVREVTEDLVKIRTQQSNLTKKYQYIEKIKPNFTKTAEDLKNQKARDIYDGDQNAMSVVPTEIIDGEIKNRGFNPQDFNEDKYMPKESYFLVPWNKVTQGNSEAILALILASIIDGTSLILGSIVNKKDENTDRLKNFRDKIFLQFNESSKVLKELLPSLIEETGHIIFTILRALGSILHGLFFGLISAKNRGLQIFIYTSDSIRIEGSRKEFLSGLWNSIEFYYDDEVNDKHEIRILYKKLMFFAQNNESFKRGYKRLIIDMCYLKWLEKQRQNYEVIFKIIEYEKFSDWYQKEESKQLDNEKHSMLSPNEYYTFINIPKKRYFYQSVSKKIIFWFKQVF